MCKYQQEGENDGFEVKVGAHQSPVLGPLVLHICFGSSYKVNLEAEGIEEGITDDKGR